MAESKSPAHATGNAKRGKIILFGACLLAMTIVASVTLSMISINSKEKELVTTLARQQELLSHSRSEVVETWLASLAEQGDRLINADMFRLFASEVNALGSDLAPMLTPTGKDDDSALLAQQLPMMRSLLSEFASYAGFVSGRIINTSGQTYIATDAATTPLSQMQADYVKATLAAKAPHFAPARMGSNGLLLDMFLPIYPPQFEEGKGSPVAVLMLSRIVSGKISEFIATSPLGGNALRTHLIQRTGDTFEEVAPWLPEGLRKLSLLPQDLGESKNIPFAARASLDGEGQSYSSAYKLPSIDWWIVQEADYAQARAALTTYSQTITIIAVLVTLAFGLLIGSLWWFLIGVENKQDAEKFKLLADTINEQRLLLDSVNNTITDFIALKSPDGTYLYVNPAFAKAVGRPVNEMVGLDDAAIFGFETSRRLKKSDELVHFSGQSVTINETIFLQSRKYHVQISKAPFCDAEKCDGIVSVFRDVTEAVEAQERNKRVVKQTVEALVSTIEHTDPYLGGHTRMLCALSAEVAKALGMSEEELATVDAAANLSQVGKMFVPQEILNKPGQLTEEEKTQMERHVEHARDVLKNIDFDLPVVEAIYQMNERLDGSGYPKGLKDGEIMAAAKVLSLTNAFCALVRPRSYRPAKPVPEALKIMDSLKSHYEPQVIAKLKEVLNSPAGEKIIASISAA
ncbi:PAS domain-containing protein [Desulfovibrio mangrovi]|uniref:HD domain-containing phosphohydrolase n=1 Tax=Desulfovibrio mangrovi TaxID=2976983 RepID=UPI0022456070|nr:HD domain-containing phosphohydrolase [Desulfovibrio mangrovi]UZP66913.1 PAS domain-containing protein [Desulfovibrio mangrovi]